MDKIYRLRGLGCAQVDDSIWFSNHSFNALIEINKQTGQIKSMDKFPGHDIRNVWLYTDVCYLEGRLVFVPGTSDKITSYDIETREFISVALDVDLVGKDVLYFWCAYIYGKYIYMLPRKAKCIVRYDVRDNTVKYLQTSLNGFILDWPEMEAYFAGQFEVLDGMLYIPFVGINAVAVLDLKEEKVAVKYLNIGSGCSTINYVDGHFYMASSILPVIYQWNEKTGEIKKYDVFPEGFGEIGYNTCKLLFIGGINVDKKIYFFPFHGNMVISLDIKDGKIERESHIYKDIEKIPVCYYVKKYGDKECVLITNEDGLSHLDCGKGGLGEILNFMQDTPYNEKMVNDHFLENYYVECLEEKDMLSSYLKMLEDSHRRNDHKQKDRYGRSIFDQLLSSKIEVHDAGN